MDMFQRAAVDKGIAILQSIDATAHLAYSQYTDKFYVASRIEIGDGFLLTGGTEHREEKKDAVEALLEKLKAVVEPGYVVGSYMDQRREYRWNGHTFAECTRQAAMP